MSTLFEHVVPVGRAEQVAAVEQLLDALVREGDADSPQARALLVGGDAGMGKTTLVDSLAGQARAKGLTCGVGHCLDLATGTPFGPVVEGLRDVHDHLGTGAPTPPPAAWLTTDAASMSPSLEALLQATAALAHRGPV